MRVSTTFIHARGVQNILDQQAKLIRTQDQLARGEKNLLPSDNPVAASRIIDLNDAISQIDQLKENGGYATQRLNLEETTLSSVNNVLQRVRELSIQAGNTGTYDALGEKAIASEITEKLEELYGYANTKDENGDYIFSGFQSRVQAFSTDGSGNYFFNGDEGQLSIQIGSNRQVVSNNSGSEIFQKIRNGNGTFSVDANSTNGGTSRITTGSVVSPPQYQAHDFSIIFDEVLPATVPQTYTYDVYDDTLGTGVPVLSAQPYIDGAKIAFNGIEVEINGEPVQDDIFTVSSSRNQDVFSTLNNLVDSLSSPQSGDVRGVIAGGTGFDAGDVVDFNLQFNDQIIPVNFTMAVTDDNAEIATKTLNQIIAAVGPANSDGSVTLAGTTAGTDITFRLNALGTGVEFLSSGGDSDSVNTFSVTNLRDSGLDDAVLNLTASGNTLASGVSTTTSATASNIAAVRTDISAGLDLSAAGALARTFSLEVDGTIQSVVVPAVDYTITGVGDGTSAALLSAINTAINTAFGSQVATASESTANGLALTTASTGAGSTITVAEAAGPSTGAAALFGAAIGQVSVGTGDVTFVTGTPPRTFLSQQIDAALNNIDQAMDGIINVQTSIGGRINSIESQADDNLDKKIYLETVRSEIKDLDFAEAISNMTFQTTVLQVAQQTFAKIQNLSLFNFI